MSVIRDTAGTYYYLVPDSNELDDIETMIDGKITAHEAAPDPHPLPTFSTFLEKRHND